MMGLKVNLMEIRVGVQR
ncbi:hypothetical protein Gotur_017181 [Gossypium turneri]